MELWQFFFGFTRAIFEGNFIKVVSAKSSFKLYGKCKKLTLQIWFDNVRRKFDF